VVGRREAASLQKGERGPGNKRKPGKDQGITAKKRSAPYPGYYFRAERAQLSDGGNKHLHGLQVSRKPRSNDRATRRAKRTGRQEEKGRHRAGGRKREEAKAETEAEEMYEPGVPTK